MQEDTPTTDQYYQMVVAAEIRRANVKDPRSVKLDDFKLVRARKIVSLDFSPEDSVARSKAIWLAATGYGR